MFDDLSRYFSDVLDHLRGRGRLTSNERAGLLGDLKRTLLDADVALHVAGEFVATMERRLLSPEFDKSISPRQFIGDALHDELTALMGRETAPLDLGGAPPRVVVMAGLHGAGKTTTAAKLAKLLIGEGRKVVLASCDVYRPAAARQLEVLASQAGAPFYSDLGDWPVEIADRALRRARLDAVDVLVLDMAGRMHVDDGMMRQASAICSAVDPAEVLYVVDCMSGQDAAVSARAFDERLPLTGVVLSKADSDARGGALLSVCRVTGRPVKFVATGERVDAMEVFHPRRMAERILGMGDIEGLVRKLGDKGTDEKGADLVRKIRKKRAFTMLDLRKQLVQSCQMGGLAELVDHLPAGMGRRIDTATLDKEATKAIAVIDSMTKEERLRPELFNGSRKRRVAGGAGVQVQDVNRVIKQFNGAQKMMRKAASMGQGGMMRMLSGHMPRGMSGGMPGARGKPHKRRGKRRRAR